MRAIVSRSDGISCFKLVLDPLKGFALGLVRSKGLIRHIDLLPSRLHLTYLSGLGLHHLNRLADVGDALRRVGGDRSQGVGWQAQKLPRYVRGDRHSLAVRALLAKDLSDREITHRVGVSPSTVATV